MIAAGRLNSRVTVTQYVQSTDEIGGQSAITSNRSIWANVKPMKGSRAMQYAQIVDGQPYDVIIRYFDKDLLRTGDTVTYNGRVITIHTISEQDENYIQFMGVERNT